MNMMEKVNDLPLELQSIVLSNLPQEHVLAISGISRTIAEIIIKYNDELDIPATLIELNNAMIGFDNTNTMLMHRLMYDTFHYLIYNGRYASLFDNIPLISDLMEKKHILSSVLHNVIEFLASNRRYFNEGVLNITEYVRYEGHIPEVVGASVFGNPITETCAIVQLLAFIKLNPFDRTSIIMLYSHERQFILSKLPPPPQVVALPPPQTKSKSQSQKVMTRSKSQSRKVSTRI
jgi:hypothetical protein